MTETVTVIFHGRRDLGTLETYVAYGSKGAGATVPASELLRVPCDLDLAAAEDRDEAERLYAEQAMALRDALVGADTVLDVWREPLDLSPMAASLWTIPFSCRSDCRGAARCPPPWLPPTASWWSCGWQRAHARGGMSPVAFACAQPDLTRVSPLTDDPAPGAPGLPRAGCRARRTLVERLAHEAGIGRAVPRAERRAALSISAAARARRRRRLYLVGIVSGIIFSC